MNRGSLYLSTVDENAHILARQYGLGLELAEYCTPWFLDREFLQTDRLVREKLTGIGTVVLHAPYSELFPCAIDPMIREVAQLRYRQTIQVARSYGSRKVIIHGGYNPRIYYPQWYTPQSVEFWRGFLGEVPEDMVICLENVFEEEPEMIVKILEQVNDPRLRMCLDIGHVNAYSAIPAVRWLERCAPWIDHFHIHNNDTSRDSHNPLMEGSLDYRALLARMEQLCPDATVTLELMDAQSSVRWLLEVN